ncbi:MAG: ATP-binding protein [Desulfobacterales bacterium]|nr:ATP-binding protein [Desulfobacterales bacterium]
MTFQVSRRSNFLSIKFSACFQHIDQAVEEIKRFLTENGLEYKSFGIVLSLREALLNAVIHGSNQNPYKMIQFKLHLNVTGLIIEIEDQGPGFDWKTFLNRKWQSTMESKRGLAIMKFYFSNITYNNKGNKILLKKQLLPHNQ